MHYFLFALCAVLLIVAVKSIMSKSPETPAASPDPAPQGSSSELFFKLVMDEAAGSLFEKYGEPNPDFSMSKRELIDAGYIDERVFRYYEIEGVPEIADGVVSFSGAPVGRVKRNDKKKIEELIASGHPFSVGIYGGEYKRIISEWDGDREVFEYEKDEAPVSATLRIKK